MKKTYEKPFAELVKFDYKDQVVVASGCSVNIGPASGGSCSSWQGSSVAPHA